MIRVLSPEPPLDNDFVYLAWRYRIQGSLCAAETLKVSLISFGVGAVSQRATLLPQRQYTG